MCEQLLVTKVLIEINYKYNYIDGHTKFEELCYFRNKITKD